MKTRSFSSSSSSSSSSFSSFSSPLILIFLYLSSSFVLSSIHQKHRRDGEKREKVHITLNEQMSNVTLQQGRTLKLRCEITGSPLPRYTWYKDGLRVTRGRMQVKGIAWGSRLRVAPARESDSGLYNCTGRNGGGSVSTVARVTVVKDDNEEEEENDDDDDGGYDYVSEGDDEDEDDDVSYSLGGLESSLEEGDDRGICERYEGEECRGLLAGRHVFVYDINQQAMQHEWLQDILSRLSASRDISPHCRGPLHASLCLFAFPTCNPREGDERGGMEEERARKLCRDECEVVKEVHCRREYLVLRGGEGGKGGDGGGFGAAKDIMVGVARRDNLKKVLNVTDCSQLQQDRQHCNSASIPLAPYDSHEKCYHGDGSAYRGAHSNSVSSRQCQQWSVASASFEPSPSGFVLMTHNYCRNVNSTMTSPWCYVIKAGVTVKESCGILPCAAAEDKQHTALLLGVSCLLLLLLLAGLVAVAKVKKHRSKQKELAEVQSSRGLLDRQSITSRRTLPSITPSSLTWFGEMFEGRFGKVFKGELRSPVTQKPTHVIIYTLSASASVETQSLFWRHLDALTDLHHCNVTAALAASKITTPFLALFEGSCHGSLNHYLRHNSKLLESPCIDIGHMARSSMLPAPVLVSVAIQVASALEYLHTRAHTHQHLSSLVVLVCDNGLLKVSLVTPCKGLYYYEVAGRLLLLRWTAPEVLAGGEAGEKSDVWSLGVLLWEVYTCADVPYKSHTDPEVLELVTSMKVLSCPPQCPSPLYALMLHCWQASPVNRPTASEVLARLRSVWNDVTTGASASSSSEQSQQNLDANKCLLDFQPLATARHTQQGVPFNYQPLVNREFPCAQSNNPLPTQSSNFSQNSTPSSSTVNFKDKVKSTETPKLYGFLNKELYNEEII